MISHAWRGWLAVADLQALMLASQRIGRNRGPMTASAQPPFRRESGETGRDGGSLSFGIQTSMTGHTVPDCLSRPPDLPRERAEAGLPQRRLR